MNQHTHTLGVIILMLAGNIAATPTTQRRMVPQKRKILTTPRTLARADELDAHITQKTGKSDKSLYPSLQMLAEVIARCEEKAFRAVDFKKFLEEAIIAAAPLIDSHSAFYNQDAYKNMLESTAGAFFGIGVTVTSKLPDDDMLTIVDVLDDGPAANAIQIIENGSACKNGLCSGDEIIEINGEKMHGLSSDECICKLKGPADTEVRLKVIRKKKMLEFTVTRGEVKHPVAQCYQFPENNIWYISLKLFTDNATTTLAPMIKQAVAKKATGIILDLRHNPGGVLDAGIDIAGLFVPKGSLIVSTKDRHGATTQTFSTVCEPIFHGGTPIVVLVDNYSASASEILAGALRYYSETLGMKRLAVFVVGTQTYGKGSVQEVIPVCNGCALKLTTMLYYLPDGVSIQALGVVPDIVVAAQHPPREDERLAHEFQGSERSLRYHISRDEVHCIEQGKPIPARNTSNTDNTASSASSPAGKTSAERRIKTLSEDNQVHAALTLLNMYNFALKTAPDRVKTRPDALKLLSSLYATEKNAQPREIILDDTKK